MACTSQGSSPALMRISRKRSARPSSATGTGASSAKLGLSKRSAARSDSIIVHS
jgi:hypothetical protein